MPNFHWWLYVYTKKLNLKSTSRAQYACDDTWKITVLRPKIWSEDRQNWLKNRKLASIVLKDLKNTPGAYESDK